MAQAEELKCEEQAGVSVVQTVGRMGAANSLDGKWQEMQSTRPMQGHIIDSCTEPPQLQTAGGCLPSFVRPPRKVSARS